MRMPKFTGSHGERFLFQYDVPTSNIGRQRCICFTADIRILYGEGDDEDRSNRLKQHPHIIVHQKSWKLVLCWSGLGSLHVGPSGGRTPFSAILMNGINIIGRGHSGLSVMEVSLPSSVRFDSSFICFLHEYKLQTCFIVGRLIIHHLKRVKR